MSHDSSSACDVVHFSPQNRRRKNGLDEIQSVPSNIGAKYVHHRNHQARLPGGVGRGRRRSRDHRYQLQKERNETGAAGREGR